MLDVQKIVIEHFVQELRDAYQQTYNLLEAEYGNICAWTGRLALENIANSDALYHNVEHTVLVTMVGQSILKGKQLLEGGVTPKDWMLYTIALLCHDIGYVKGICRADSGERMATGRNGETVSLPPAGTDAALQPYHVDRSKLFVRERFANSALTEGDVNTICDYIEMTRFPIPDNEFHRNTAGFRGLARAADFIGQLGDPKYLRKIPALFYEFEETGANAIFGYKAPGDLREGYDEFYWKVVSGKIQEALRYLRVTTEGKLWIANLHSHVFDSEHNKRLL
ncbi:MAG: metal-dependent phosphohydrolase [Chloroflexi bacterium]|nr:metal-dependent phosphohydrolase [Chloroflexota bacterium]